MNEDKVKEFDKYFNANYIKIKRSAKTLMKHSEDYEDVLHNVFLTIRDRISRKGFEGTKYGGYIYISLMNEFKLSKNKEKKNITLDIDDEVIMNIAEWCMEDYENSYQSHLNYVEENEYITKVLFEFIGKNFNEKECFIFRTYYLSKDKMTYKRLADITKYEYSTLQQMIKEIKKKIRLEFIFYLNNHDTIRKNF